MERRNFISGSIALWATVHPIVRIWNRHAPSSPIRLLSTFQGPIAPVFIYNNWSAYDELSDNVAQTETLAMRELSEILRLKKLGVKFDYYVMDAFWFDKDGGYRSWHKTHWPNGPDKWLQKCKENHILPGMWFSTNLVTMGGKTALAIIPEWKDSVATDPNILCLFDGGYRAHLAGTLQMWHDKGVRLFKFDFAYFEAVTARWKDKLSADEIKEKNKTAFMEMLRAFRIKNPGVLITAYNGFGGDMENTVTPFRKTIDMRWMEVFDSIYCGDPRFSDVPMINIWRSQDNYSDHMERQYEFNGLPTRRIDSCAFMIGTTGTCYYRGMQSWKSMLILELARGGWINVYHGNLELLNDADAKWFARIQSIYHDLQRQDQISSFGAIPGERKPYGFKAIGKNGMLFAVVNPSQDFATIALPGFEGKGRLLYSDGGYNPQLTGRGIALGPEQLAMVGVGKFASSEYDLGRDEIIRIPNHISRIATSFTSRARNEVTGTVQPVEKKNIRIIFRQLDDKGVPFRSWGGAPPEGKKMDAILQIVATQGNEKLPIEINYDKMIWSGLSWAAGEISAVHVNAQRPVSIICRSLESKEVLIVPEVYFVAYE